MSNGNEQGASPSGLTVAVVGAGRIGSELIRNLSLMGIGRIDVYERDSRASDALRNRYTVFDGDFWDTLTLSRLQDYDFAVCTIDDDAARRRMNWKCLVANVSLVFAQSEGALARVAAYPFGAHEDAACAECGTSGRMPALVPIASLRLAVADPHSTAATATAASVATASVAGALAAAVIARIASGSHGSVARTATLDATQGQGTSLEVRRDPHCPRCAAMQRPVRIVRTRNRWDVSSSLSEVCPGMLDQRLQLSDEIAGLQPGSCSVRELSVRYQGGPVPAKFALTAIGGRTICLAFEDCEPASDATAGMPRVSASSNPVN
jgi:hypothetical protein